MNHGFSKKKKIMNHGLDLPQEALMVQEFCRLVQGIKDAGVKNSRPSSWNPGRGRATPLLLPSPDRGELSRHQSPGRARPRRRRPSPIRSRTSLSSFLSFTLLSFLLFPLIFSLSLSCRSNRAGSGSLNCSIWLIAQFTSPGECSYCSPHGIGVRT
jgi:hypothetical protein